MAKLLGERGLAFELAASRKAPGNPRAPSPGDRALALRHGPLEPFLHPARLPDRPEACGVGGVLGALLLQRGPGDLVAKPAIRILSLLASLCLVVVFHLTHYNRPLSLVAS